jgi:predicted transcriptional regulator
MAAEKVKTEKRAGTVRIRKQRQVTIESVKGMV